MSLWPTNRLKSAMQAVVVNADNQYQSLTDREGPLFDYQSIYKSDSFNSVFKYNKGRTQETLVNISAVDDDDKRESWMSRFIQQCVIVGCWFICILTFPVTAWMAVKRLKPHERLVIFRLGRLQPSKGPGIVCIIPKVDSYRMIDTRTRAFNVPPQKVFTSDNAVIEVGADVYFRIEDAVKSVLHIQDLSQSLRVLAQLTLMNSLSKIVLKRIQGDRLNLGDEMKDTMNNTAWNWGIQTEKFEMSHVTVIHHDPPMNAMSRVMNACGNDSGNDSGMTEEHAAIMKLMGAVLNNKSESAVVDFTALSAPGDTTTYASAPCAGTPPPGEPPTPTLAEVIVCILRDILDQAMVSELQAVYKFILSGDGGGVFHLNAKYGHGSAGVGDPPQVPDVTVTSSCKDFHRLITGDVNPLSLYMNGCLIVEGDLALAMRLDVLTDKISKFLKQETPASQNKKSSQFAEGFVHHV